MYRKLTIFNAQDGGTERAVPPAGSDRFDEGLQEEHAAQGGEHLPLRRVQEGKDGEGEGNSCKC